MVVLARVGSALLGPQIELRRRGIPVVQAVGLQWLQRTGVRAALAWLRLAGSPAAAGRSADVAEAARRPSAGRSRTLVGWMAEQSDVGGLRALAGRLKAERDQTKVTALRRAARAADGAGRRHHRRPGRRPSTALRGAGLDDTLDALDRYRHDQTRAAHLDDLDSLVDLARGCPDPGALPGAGCATSWPSRATRDGVRLSTVHRVKGLEWPHVVVHDASDALFPHRLTVGRGGLEEERRVFHVAITRCRSTCTVVAPGRRAVTVRGRAGGRQPDHPAAGRSRRPLRSAPAHQGRGGGQGRRPRAHRASWSRRCGRGARPRPVRRGGRRS